MNEQNDRVLSMEWFSPKSDDEKIDLKNKYFPATPIDFSDQWGFHFTFGQILEMYLKELPIKDES